MSAYGITRPQWVDWNILLTLHKFEHLYSENNPCSPTFLQSHKPMTLKIWVKIKSCYTWHIFLVENICTTYEQDPPMEGKLLCIHCFIVLYGKFTNRWPWRYVWRSKVIKRHTFYQWWISVPSMKRIPQVEGKLWRSGMTLVEVF